MAGVNGYPLYAPEGADRAAGLPVARPCVSASQKSPGALTRRPYRNRHRWEGTDIPRRARETSLRNIGQSIAGRAVACGMKIIYNNRRRLPEEIEQRYNAQYVDLETLLRTSDFVSLNLPYTPDSHHIINENTLSMMKQGAVLINTARGAHIDEAALVRHLRSGHLYGAALDVYEFEPKVTPELLELDNVVLSPHIGTGTIDGRIAMCHCCSDNINWFLNGEHHKMNRVN